MSIRHDRFLPWVLLVVYAVFLVLTLPSYGVTWDEIGWFRYGGVQWHWILNSAAASLQDPRDYFYYGSVPSLMAAATHYLFHNVLHLVSSDIGYHLANVGFALLLALGILVWGKQTMGNKGAALALLLWMLLPRLWPDAHDNISDLPGAAGYLWAAWGVWRLFQRSEQRRRDYAFCGFLIGIAYSLRAPNTYFLAVSIVLWVVGCRWLLNVKRLSLTWQGVLLVLFVFFVTVKLANPYLWHESVLRRVLWNNPNAYVSGIVGKEDLWFMGHYFELGRIPIYYAPWTWLITTPLVILFCLGIGVVKICCDRSNTSTASFFWLVLWGVAVFKHLTGHGNYDGIRHFLESYAPMTLLATQGLLLLLRRIKDMSFWWQRSAYIFLCLCLASPLYVGWRIHPYQSGYFNIFAGPLPAAWRQYEVDYWGQSFLPASRWVKENINPKTMLYVPDAGHIAEHYLDPPFNISTMNIYAFHGVDEFTSSLTSILEKASSGSVLMALNRMRVYHRDISSECPSGWEMIHKEGPDPKLPAMMVICRKEAER
jgi:hypothetical protein